MVVCFVWMFVLLFVINFYLGLMFNSSEYFGAAGLDHVIRNGLENVCKGLLLSSMLSFAIVE